MGRSGCDAIIARCLNKTAICLSSASPCGGISSRSMLPSCLELSPLSMNDSSGSSPIGGESILFATEARARATDYHRVTRQQRVNKFRMNHLVCRPSPAPFVKSPLSSFPPAEQSLTASYPSRSSLSIARSTVSLRSAFSSPPSPRASITPSSTLRLLTLIT